MDQQPLVSVIVPIYNAKNHIARCVESIRKQSYPNLEILLVNDGSKDVSLQVCEMYAKVDPRILLVDKPNSGVAATRNLGLRLALGKYLQFVDADDTLQPDATRLMVEKAEQYDTDLVIAHYNRVTPPPEKPSLPKAMRDTTFAEKFDETMERLLPSDERVQTFGFLLEAFDEFCCGESRLICQPHDSFFILAALVPPKYLSGYGERDSLKQRQPDK